jgi:hypothetical protein
MVAFGTSSRRCVWPSGNVTPVLSTIHHPSERRVVGPGLVCKWPRHLRTLGPGQQQVSRADRRLVAFSVLMAEEGGVTFHRALQGIHDSRDAAVGVGSLAEGAGVAAPGYSHARLSIFLNLLLAEAVEVFGQSVPIRFRSVPERVPSPPPVHLPFGWYGPSALPLIIFAR